MSTIGDFAKQMETKPAARATQYFALFDRLEALQRRADRACSESVTTILQRGLDKFDDARAQYTGCQWGLCNTAKIASDVVAGGELVQKAVTASQRTS